MFESGLWKSLLSYYSCILLYFSLHICYYLFNIFSHTSVGEMCMCVCVCVCVCVYSIYNVYLYMYTINILSWWILMIIGYNDPNSCYIFWLKIYFLWFTLLYFGFYLHRIFFSIPPLWALYVSLIFKSLVGSVLLVLLFYPFCHSVCFGENNPFIFKVIIDR